MGLNNISPKGKALLFLFLCFHVVMALTFLSDLLAVVLAVGQDVPFSDEKILLAQAEDDLGMRLFYWLCGTVVLGIPLLLLMVKEKWIDKRLG